MPRGGKRLGAGRKSGTKSTKDPESLEIRNLLANLAPVAIKRLKQILMSGDDKLALIAINIILNKTVPNLESVSMDIELEKVPQVQIFQLPHNDREDMPLTDIKELK